MGNPILDKQAEESPVKQKRTFRGLEIVIEHPKGTVREGNDPDGNHWERLMSADYGCIPGTEGSGDREDVDVYVGDDESSPYVYVVEQLGIGEPDEFKVMLGFSDLNTAKESYLENYPPDWEDEHVGSISEVPFEELFGAVEEHQDPEEAEKLLKSAEARKPISSGAKLAQPTWDFSPESGILTERGFVFPTSGELMEHDHAAQLLRQFGFQVTIRVNPAGAEGGGIEFDVDKNTERVRDVIREAISKNLTEEAVYWIEFREPFGSIGPVGAEQAIEWLELGGRSAKHWGHTASLISDFVKHYDANKYNRIANAMRKLLEVALATRGIRALVTARGKSARALREKLYHRDPDKKYLTKQMILDDIKDLAGVRVALYFPGDAAKVGDIINAMFRQAREPKRFPEDATPEDAEGYQAVHYCVWFEGALVEIQVSSVLMTAWQEVTHDLVYKPMLGQLQPSEMDILYKLNGMVLEGEEHLQELQRQIEGRTQKELRLVLLATLRKAKQAMLDHDVVATDENCNGCGKIAHRRLDGKTYLYQYQPGGPSVCSPRCASTVTKKIVRSLTQAEAYVTEAGMVNKGVMYHGSVAAIIMFEHPDYPGWTATAEVSEINSADDVKRLIDAKIQKFLAAGNKPLRG